MIGVLDYGMGNLRSVEKAFTHLGHDAKIVSDGPAVAACARLVLPGVGNFADGMRLLDERGLRAPILDFVASGRPVLGVCMGMQLLMSSSTEDAPSDDDPVRGLGVVPGRVVAIRPGRGVSDVSARRGVGGADVAEDPRLKVPQMGWNALDIQTGDDGEGPRSPLMAGLEPGAHVYFVHGYYCTPDDPAVVAATANYGGPFCAAFSAGSVHACQFHPEKSQAVGLKILDNFARLPA